MGLHPVPYYIVALVLLIVFGFLWPVLPISGGSAMNIPQGWTWTFMLSVLKHSILPALSLILIGLGSWFLGMRSLVSNIVTEDYVVYAELGGVDARRILSSYVMRNALVPQVTGLAMSLGAIFNGAVITEKVFGYPGLGSLLVDAVYAGDYGLVLGVTTVSILGVSVGVLSSTCSIRSSIRACRCRDAGDLSRPAALQPRIPHRRLLLIIIVLVMAGLSLCLALPPDSTSMSCRPTCRPAGTLVRHHLARAGRVLAAHLRHAQHADLRLHRRDPVARPLAA